MRVPINFNDDDNDDGRSGSDADNQFYVRCQIMDIG